MTEITHMFILYLTAYRNSLQLKEPVISDRSRFLAGTRETNSSEEQSIAPICNKRPKQKAKGGSGVHFGLSFWTCDTSPGKSKTSICQYNCRSRRFSRPTRGSHTIAAQH